MAIDRRGEPERMRIRAMCRMCPFFLAFVLTDQSQTQLGHYIDVR